MGFFTKALDFITPWDRGGEAQRRQEKKKKEEEQKQNRPAPVRNTQQTSSQAPQIKKPTNVFNDLNKTLTLTGAGQPGIVPVFKNSQAPSVYKPIDNRTPEQKELDTLYDEKLKNTTAQEEKQLGFIEKNITDRDWRKRAEVNARNQAANEYQQRRRGTADETVKKYNMRTVERAGQNSQNAQNAIKTTKNTVNTARWLPGAGLGELAANAIRGNFSGSREADDTLLREQMELTPEQIAGLSDEDRGKFLALSKGGLGAGILDVVGVGAGSLVKNVGKNTLKKITLKSLTKNLFSKQGAKAVAKNTVVGSGVGGTIGAGGTKLMGGSDEEAMQNAFSGAVGGAFGGAAQSPFDVATSLAKNIPVKAINTVKIPVKKNIQVDEVLGDNLDIPVSVTPKPQAPIIREIGGDATSATRMPTPQEVADQRVANNFANQAPSRPDQRIEGVTPKSPEKLFSLNDEAIAKSQNDVVEEYATWLRGIGEKNGVEMISDGQGGYKRVSNNVRFGDTKGKRMTKAMWRDEAERQLRTRQADPSIQRMFDDASDPEVQMLLAKGERPDAEMGRPIQVKSVTGIPVVDQTTIPTGLPETPGTVRATTQASPMEARTEAVASAPVVSKPVQLPQEVQAVLDNPKQFNKRQVASARRQASLAKRYAKTQEDTAAAMERIQNAKTNPVTGQSEDFAPTGKFRTGEKGNTYETANLEAEKALGQKEMANRSAEDLAEEITNKGSLSGGDARKISAAKENILKADPENGRNSEVYKLLDRAEKSNRTKAAQIMALVPRVIRKTASSDALTGRWERKIGNVLDDPSKMTNDQWNRVQRANDDFTVARDRASALEEQFRKTGSEADYNAWEKAHNAARDADTSARMAEVKVGQEVLKGEKGANVTKTLDDLKKQADVNTMDLVTANMLSGTGTGFRNTFGTELAGIENRIGANVRAKVTKAIFGENVGGFDKVGAGYGRKVGLSKWVGDAKRRAENGGKNPLEWAKNWATTINSGGESSLQSQVYSRLGKYYKNQFAGQGLSGKDLDLRMKHAMITDPDNMAETYLDASMKSSGLSGLFEKGQTVEKAITDAIGKKVDSKLVQGAAKLIMRMAVGFPTATGNFLYQSGKRLTLGMPSYIESGVKAAKGDKAGAALAFERAMKETGSGGAILGLGVMLGSSDMISGAYPTDQNERDRWTREGISENSIKIGGAWYPIPQGAGMFGLPLLTGAAIGRDGAEGVKEMYNPANLSKLLPTDQIQGFLNMLSGDGGPQDLKNTIASSVRAGTPVGALFNQIAKSFDPTKNDTTSKDFWSNVLDQIYSGIPGVNNAMGIPDKTDKEGNVIQNPNPLELAFGASSAVQGGGEQRSQEIDNKINDSLKQIDQYGLLGDPNMEGVLEGSGLEAFTKASTGKQLDESDIKALKEGLVKGVSSEGTDTAYLERGQYDTNLAVLQLKRDLMQEDKTTKPSSLKDIETAIKRGTVYKDNQVPYESITDYKSIGVEEWRNMGDPEDDAYDPDMYQKLWDIDQLMTNAGVSYKKGALDKPKYFVKEKKSGKGGSGGRQIDTSFGTLKAGTGAPSVQQYESIDAKSGSVPRIAVKRPNIVHNIGKG